jgi:alpha-N-arabinofuranosidase
MGWTFQPKKPQEGEVLVVNRKEVNTANPRYLQVKKQTDDFELVNEGFKGMGVKKGLRYDFSVMYRQSTPGVKLVLLLKDANNKIIGQGSLIPDQTGSDWKNSRQVLPLPKPTQKQNLPLGFREKEISIWI